ncbi:MAG: type IX secretion system sortase PorU [Bacteroidales bacterium]|nr:type IX secretion system sortase PorU [Bacteroidales bacterium]
MKTTRLLLLFLTGLLSMPLRAQWTDQSVLRDGTWYKVGVLEDGVYAIDGASLQSAGVSIGQVDPARIRLFGNVAKPLPELNSDARYDDLTEVAIEVTGADDGVFDVQDRILFYGQGPVTMTLGLTNTYSYERHPYTDTIYYFLCVDGMEPGLRMETAPAAQAAEGDPCITQFPDYWNHESEELSPYASGRTWYGDMITAQEGSKTFHYPMPDYVRNKPVRLYSKVLGRCVSPFTYSMSLNGVEVVQQATIDSFKSHVFGIEKVVDRILTLDQEGFALRYEVQTTGQQPLLYIDYFTVNFWRELRFEERELAFRVIPAQLTAPTAEVVVAGISDGVCCWEVTDPLHPLKQPLQRDQATGSFGVEGQRERRYHLFDAAGVKPVASLRRIANQNLHALAGTEYLIVTSRLFWEPAQALAAFHREEDGLSCLVVDVEEICNEFGTGTPDPTALRDFIRMLYLRSNAQLRYVLLFGKGTHDYRDLKGRHNNFVPTYEVADQPWYEVATTNSDDYFALMDPQEGDRCSGKVDLGVGRLPVTTCQQAEEMVEKIKRYADRSVTHGPWLNRHLFMADNDSKSYIDYVEILDRTLDTAGPNQTSQKLYVDAYPVVNTPAGQRVPEAHDALLACFEEGFAVLSYTGHGGIKGLTEEKVLTNSDIQAMTNGDRLPFVHTATCEFSKFDNPNVVSAGELMILNPHGGAIGMLTSLIPTYSQNNQKLSRAFTEHVYDLDHGERLRFGDLYRLAKSDLNYFHSGNICFVLFGDPALRLACPSDEVRTLQVDTEHGHSYAVPASGMVTLTGCVATLGRGVDTLFNGVVDVRLYDKKSRFSTLGSHVSPVQYSYYHDVLFEGKASVTEGRFSITIPIPSEINFGSGSARVCYYAYDSLRRRHAGGVFDQLQVVGTDSSLVPDLQGPEIQFYWDHPSFESGDVVSRKGTLCADLFDEHGIYHYNVSIGRNIVLRSDVPEYDNCILNDHYEPAIDDYRRGRILLPVGELESGTHEFTLKVWDTQGNASEKTIVVVIEDGVMLAQVYNYPNPVVEGTYFNLRHGDMSEALRVQVEVFDLLGRQVAGLETATQSSAGVVPPIYWDGLGSNGQRLRPGLYVYRLTLTDEKGNHRSTTGRMVMR